MSIIPKHSADPKAHNPIVADVIRLACQEFGVPPAILLGPKRLQQEVNARKVIAYVLRELGFASREISTILGRNPSCSNMINEWIGDCRVRNHLNRSATRILKAINNRDLIAELQARIAELEAAAAKRPVCSACGIYLERTTT
jgi:hypothetical protein